MTLAPDAREALARYAYGDARRALNALEVAAAAVRLAGRDRDRARRRRGGAAAARRVLYDKAGEEHYNVVSAFIKSMRGSDPDAAVYWMVRMLEAGEDPLFVLRRMVIFASEDVGQRRSAGARRSRSRRSRRSSSWGCPRACCR